MTAPFAHLATDHGVRGAVAVPIHLDGRLWGALGSMTDRPGGFIAETEALLERCAEVVALALASVRSHRALRREARLEKALREISTASASGELDAPGLFDLVAARICDILDAPAALITRAEEQRSVLVGTHGPDSLPDTLTLGERAAVTIAWRSGRPARVGDYAEIAGVRLRAGVRSARGSSRRGRRCGTRSRGSPACTANGDTDPTPNPPQPSRPRRRHVSSDRRRDAGRARQAATARR